MAFLRYLTLTVALSLAACGGSGGESTNNMDGTDAGGGDASTDSGTGDSDAGSDSGTSDRDAGPGVIPCNPDRDLIATSPTCRVDSDCPCGSACDLGRCVAECLSDDDCDGVTCSTLGVCGGVEPNEQTFQVGEQGWFDTVPRSIPPLELGNGIDLELVARGSGVDRFRVNASDGLELECDGGEATQECLIETAVAPGEPYPIRITATQMPVAGELQFIEVRTPGRFRTVSMIPPEDPSTSVLNFNPTGVWSGTMRVVHEGYGGNEDFTVEAPRPISIPLTAQVYAASGSSQGVFVLRDDLGLIHPSGEWIAALDLSGATETAAFPSYLVTDQLEAGAPTRMLVSAPVVDLEFGSLDSVLTFDLPVLTEGTMYEGGAMERLYRVQLRRSGDLPLNSVAPPVPASDTLTQDRGQVVDLTPSESYLYDAIWSSAPSLTTQDVFDRFEQQYTGELRTCTFFDHFDHQYVYDVWTELWIEPGGRRTLSEWDQLPGTVWDPWVNILQNLTVNSQPVFSTTDDLSIRTGFTEPVLKNSWPWFDIPCDYTIEGATLDTDPALCGTSTVTIPDINVNDCAAQRALHGCEIVDDPYLTDSTTWKPSFSGGPGTCSGYTNQDNQTVVRSVCRMPAAPETCAESVLCNSSVPSNQVDFKTGDFMCADGVHGVAVSADVRAATAPPSAPVTTDDILSDCMAELAAVANGPPAAIANDYRAALAPTNCLNPARFFLTLGVALNGNRHQDSNWALYDAIYDDYQQYGRTPRNERIALRLIQRWLELHGLLAHEPAEREILGAIIREEMSTVDVPALTDALDVSVRAWQLFYHPRFALPLARLTDESMLEPDWRSDLDPGLTTEQHHNYQRGLAVAVLATLESQLKLAEIILEQASLASDTSVLQSIEPLLQHAERMRTWAAGYYARAAQIAFDNGQPLDWELDYERARLGVDGQLLQVFNVARALKNGSNPLGIEDSDLPLYFFGGETDPSERFSAISDFLVGRPGTPSVGWAQQLADDAEISYTASRAKWDTLRQREWMEELSDVAQQQERERDMRLSYGDKINDLCFLDTNSSDVLDLPTLSPQTCFIDESIPECQFDMQAFAQGVRVEDVEYQLCLGSRGASEVAGELRFDDDRMENLRQLYVDGAVGTVSYSPSCAEFAAEGAGCFTADTTTQGTVVVPVTPNSIRLRVPSNEGEALAQVISDCQVEHPNARIHPPAPSRLEDPRCLRGAMGETALTILSAATDVEIAVAELDERMDAYNVSMNRCIVLQDSADAIEEARTKHSKHMKDLRVGKMAADIAATLAAGAKDCLNSVQNATGDAALSMGASVAVSAGVCAASAIEAGSRSTSITYETDIEQSKTSHENTIDGLERTGEIEACKAEAGIEKVGMDSAKLRIQKAMQDLVVAQYRLDQQKREVSILFLEGKAELEWIAGRKVTPPTGELWLDEDVERFRRRMRLARRVTYLAVRAIEYEYQSSLAARGDVLSATRPQDLKDVLNELRTSSATRGINGNRAADLKFVVSLRDNLMQLQDRTEVPEGWSALTEIQRFRELLLSQRFRTYDDEGIFTGLTIPFELAPLEALGLGETNGIGIFSANDCAERIWSANASVVGSDQVLRGGSTFTRMDLLKRNTFYSQWCSAPGADQQDFQYASVRPSKNLFREPGWGTEFGESNLGIVKATDVFTRARLQPAVNVPRVEFEDDGYANGQTSELAGRGLYGDYAIFIPANMLSRDENSVLSDGLDVQQLDDILIRFDYLSVAK